MKILFDDQIFSKQKFGGISRYFFELITAFDRITDVEAELPLILSNNHYISQNDKFRHMNFFPEKDFRGKFRVISKINRMNVTRKLKQKQFDIFHSTYYDPYFLKYIGDKPFVLTVHDMIHERFPEYFKDDTLTKWKKLLVKKATKIIAISNNTKKDIIEIFGTNPDKIDVIYHGNSLLDGGVTNVGFFVPEKYILFVGSRSVYKNFKFFTEAISDILRQKKDISLICVGGGKFNDEELHFLQDNQIEEKVVQYDLTDDKLRYFYNNAILFAFPSLYEGFGIPVLESFACGCPLVCSNTSSLPEIAGDGAVYFDPENKESIKAAIEKVIDNDGIRENLIQKGHKRLQDFSWHKTAQETIDVYRSILK